MTSLKEFRNTIEFWRKQYGQGSNPIPSTNLTQISITCVACGKLANCRHHKGSQLWLALRWPELFAARYIQFHPADVAKLCGKCHDKVERAYIPLKEERNAELRLASWNALVEGRRKSEQEKLEFGNKWIKRFEEKFDKWLFNQQNRNAKISAEKGSSNTNQRPRQSRKSLRSRNSKRKNRSRRRGLRRPRSS